MMALNVQLMDILDVSLDAAAIVFTFKQSSSETPVIVYDKQHAFWSSGYHG